MNSRSRDLQILTAIASAILAFAALPAPARADVTVGQKTSLSLAGFKMDMNTVERTSGGKQRQDTTSQCHGFFALICHDIETGRIVRLDKRLEWQLEPKKKLYTERRFPTATERAQAQQQLQAAIEEMKKCPMPQPQNPSQAAPDTTHCQLSAPVLNVTQTDHHATIAGHDARETNVVLSQTCTDPKTGDVCEIDYGFQTWLTKDDVPGAAERQAFENNYLTAQGLNPNSPRLQKSVMSLMAPYADMLRQLRGKAAQLQGYPLRTKFYMAFGGPHCGRAKRTQQQQANSHPFSFHSIASHAIAGGFAGFFHHAAAAIHGNSAGGQAAAGAVDQAAAPTANAAANAVAAQPSGAAPAVPPGPMIRVISLTTETTSIDTSSIPAEEFDIPPGWTLKPQSLTPAKRQAASCPTMKP